MRSKVGPQPAAQAAPLPAHRAMMPYALKALAYFLGAPGASLPSDCMRTWGEGGEGCKRLV